jgi:hypothetical protein
MSHSSAIERIGGNPAPLVFASLEEAAAAKVENDQMVHDAIAQMVADEVSASGQTLHDVRVGHRESTKIELAAKTDFSKMQKTWQDQTGKLVQSFQDKVRGKQIDELVAQVEAAVTAEDIEALASVQATTIGADVISEAMTRMMDDSIAAAKAEAKAQGVTIGVVDTDNLAQTLLNQANAIGQLISSSLSNSAATQGLQRYGVTALSAADVGSGVRDHLTSLSDSYLNDTLGGAMTSAQNQGRMLTMQQSPATAYSSELLDENTCDACEEEDGTQFDTIDDALQDYPTGGYSECAGGPRCRGTVVAVYDEASSQ